MSQIDVEILKQEKLLAKHPDQPAQWHRMGRLQRRNYQFAESIASLAKCVALAPEDLDAWSLMGFSFLDLFKIKEALETFAFVLKMRPTDAGAVFGCALAQDMLGNHAEAIELADHAVRLEPDNHKLYPLRAYLHATYDRDPATTLAYFRDWAERFADPLTYAAKPIHPDRTPGRKLRVGYVSADLRNHAVAYFIEPVLARHNPDNVHVCVFSNGAADDVTARLRRHVNQWFDISTMSDENACALIRRQKIDLLIDLSGHSQGNRLFVFARRAAPVQATWMGFMYTTGLKAMDFRITNEGSDPVGTTECAHSEQLFRLKHMACYQPPAAPLVLEPPMLAKGRVTFASLNNLKKVTNHMLGVWRRVLEQVPESILIVIGSEQNQEEAIAQQRGRLEAAGLPLDRLCIMPRLPMSGFMQMGGIVDIVLDTSPLSGGTTTVHSLWMGLPVVCMGSGQAFGNSSTMTVRSLGYPDLAVRDEDEYVAKAVELARSPRQLAEFRAGIRQRMQESYVMDYDGFVADLEAAYRLLWINYLEGGNRYLDTSHPVDVAVQACLEAALPDHAMAA